MSKTNWTRNVIALSLATATFLTSSMVGLAAPGNQSLMAELTVSGNSIDGDAPFATINNERAYSGRTVTSSTVLTTPANTSATINLGKLGRVELAPNSSLNLNFSENGINSTLISGRVRVSGAENSETTIQTKNGTVVADKADSKTFAVSLDASATRVSTETGAVTLNGSNKTVKVNAGESRSTATQDDNDGDILPGSIVVYGIVFGAAAAALIYIAARDSNDIQFGGSTNVISPTR